MGSQVEAACKEKALNMPAGIKINPTAAFLVLTKLIHGSKEAQTIPGAPTTAYIHTNSTVRAAYHPNPPQDHACQPFGFLLPECTHAASQTNRAPACPWKILGGILAGIVLGARMSSLGGADPSVLIFLDFSSCKPLSRDFMSLSVTQESSLLEVMSFQVSFLARSRS